MCSEPKLNDVYILGEKLGSGSYSVVRKGIRKVGRREVVAVKCIPKSRLKNQRAIDNIVTEIELLKSLNHEHIVRMLDFLWDRENIYLILEYCPGGDLSNFLRRKIRLPEVVARRFLQQLAQALEFMHQRNIVHMDLKPHNVLIVGDEHRMQLKIADFGFAKYLDPDNPEDVKECRGSPLYMAPELFQPGGAYTAKCDMWSVGVILYECLFGRAPYHSSTFKELEEKLVANTPIQLPPGASVSLDCEDLLHRLLQRDPKLRISHDHFFIHPFVDLPHAPSSRSMTLATDLLTRAVERDKLHRCEEALELYSEGLTHLVAAIAYEREERKKAALREKVTMYMERAEKLRQAMTVSRPSGTSEVSAEELERRFVKLKNLCSNSSILLGGVLQLRLFHKQIRQEEFAAALRTYESLFEQVYSFLQEQSQSECKKCFLSELDYALTLAEKAKKLSKRPRRPPAPRRSLSGLADEEEACRNSAKDCSVM